MRINLVTPFSEKDAVKALGGRWDAAKKCWYIVDVADLAPFMRWIPNMDAAIDVSGSAASTVKPKFTPPPPPIAATQLMQSNEKADCGCDVLPWDDCIHTAKP